MRGVSKTDQRRLRGGVILAELGPEELDAFLDTCRRQRRTTGFLGGRIIAEWLRSRNHPERPVDEKQAE